MRSKGICDGKKGAVSIILGVREVDVWVELHLNMYYESYIPFVCERFEKFFVHDLSS